MDSDPPLPSLDNLLGSIVGLQVRPVRNLISFMKGISPHRGCRVYVSHVRNSGFGLLNYNY